MACLVLDFEGLDVLTHELIGDAVTIGRAPSNDIVIDHPTVSAQHARLTKSPIGYRIKDLESTNGTQINGVSISDAQLKDGAEIRFGYITGFFRDAAASIDQVRKLQLPGEHESPYPDSSSRKAVSFSSARTTKRFPSSRCASTIQIDSGLARKSPPAVHRDLAAS